MDTNQTAASGKTTDELLAVWRAECGFKEKAARTARDPDADLVAAYKNAFAWTDLIKALCGEDEDVDSRSRTAAGATAGKLLEVAFHSYDQTLTSMARTPAKGHKGLCAKLLAAGIELRAPHDLNRNTVAQKLLKSLVADADRILNKPMNPA